MKTNSNYVHKAIASPKVTLVGAGPGDPDLLTIKGARAISNANAILYDSLVNAELLELAPKDCLNICVGKRADKPSWKQEEINQLLADTAMTHGNVVRLKGGDPFVFGRGAEETSFLDDLGIPTEIVPGLSSALAVPSSQGIPLTRRKVNESFWVLTGTLSNGDISSDIKHGARSSATLVILMGLRNFDQIMDELKNYRCGKTPVAIIQNGTKEEESIHMGSLKNHMSLKEKIDYSAPGIILVGDVIAEHPGYLDDQIQRVLENLPVL